MDVKEMIGARIKDLRTAKGITQDRLSELVGINSKYLSSIERGKENPTLNTILRIAEALETRVDDIFAGIEVLDPKNRKRLIDGLLKKADDEQLKLAYQILSAIIR